jgi:hypothetical protein
MKLTWTVSKVPGCSSKHYISNPHPMVKFVITTACGSSKEGRVYMFGGCIPHIGFGSLDNCKKACEDFYNGLLALSSPPSGV